MKRVFDVALSLLALVLLAPVMLVVAAAIALESGRPVLFRQQRVGRGDREFGLYKFRSMVKDAAAIGPYHTASNDPRITRVGRFIRRTSLDEMPQLLNVLKGEMSIVGPRPDVPAQRALDLTLSIAGLIALAPLMAAVALAIKLDSPGPIFFRQRRHGFNNEVITVWKFRSMRNEHADATAARQVVDGDTRVTRVGRFIRRTSLDELPQLFNVLRGDMTLVGPRPCLGWEAEMFPAEFTPRFEVRPGLTGLWQVSGRSALGTLEMLELDVRYVRSRSLQSDLGILIRTVPALLGSGAR